MVINKYYRNQFSSYVICIDQMVRADLRFFSTTTRDVNRDGQFCLYNACVDNGFTEFLRQFLWISRNYFLREVNYRGRGGRRITTIIMICH